MTPEQVAQAEAFADRQRHALQVSEALVTLARATGMMAAFGKNTDFLGEGIAESCTLMAEELDLARETLRLATGAP